MVPVSDLRVYFCRDCLSCRIHLYLKISSGRKQEVFNIIILRIFILITRHAIRMFFALCYFVSSAREYRFTVFFFRTYLVNGKIFLRKKYLTLNFALISSQISETLLRSGIIKWDALNVLRTSYNLPQFHVPF